MNQEDEEQILQDEGLAQRINEQRRSLQPPQDVVVEPQDTDPKDKDFDPTQWGWVPTVSLPKDNVAIDQLIRAGITPQKRTTVSATTTRKEVISSKSILGYIPSVGD